MVENYKNNIVDQLVSPDGELHRHAVALPFSFQEEGYFEEALYAHQKRFLEKWVEDDSFFKKFHKFSLPLCHAGAEKLIRSSLSLPSSNKLTTAHVRKAVVSACLAFLRQTVGSCFATAPALIIHTEQTDLFVDDLLELLTTGRLKRVKEGVQISVPLSPGWHKGMDDHALLKAWEYTLASFSETKSDFSKWNFHVSLGIHPQQKGGLGEVMYEVVQQKLDEANKNTDKFHLEAVQAQDQVRLSEALMRQASSVTQAKTYEAEARGKLYHLHVCVELRDHWAKLARKFADFVSFLIPLYEKKFIELFQEIYDPEMADFSVETYEDSPAGFRLYYKHGLADASRWTPIRSGEEFCRFLIDFLIVTSEELERGFETEEEKKCFLEIQTRLIERIRSPIFLETALERGERHKAKPWSYISGGTVETVVENYFCRTAPLTKEERTVENEMDLALFIIETLKALPSRVLDPFLKDPSKGMLMRSPTHAFVLHPGWKHVRSSWEENVFSYTYVRDHFVQPMQHFYQTLSFSRDEQRFLMQKTGVSFAPTAHMDLPTLAHALASAGFTHTEAFLYASLPLTPLSQYQAVLQQLIGFSFSLPDSLPPYLTAEELRRLAKNLLFRAHPRPDVHSLITARSQALHLAPTPLIFADSNWVNSYLAFVVNPATTAFELWRVDPTGCTGAPLPSWKPYLNSHNKIPWTIYTQPHEYVGKK